MSGLLLIVLVLAAVGRSAAPTRAATCGATTRVWIGETGGNWSTPGNWDANTVPVDGDAVIFPLSSTGTVNVDTSVHLASIRFDGDGYTLSGTGTLTLDCDNTNGIIYTTTASSGTNTIGATLDFGAVAQIIKVQDSTDTLNISGPITASNTITIGAGGYTGTVKFSGATANAITGSTNVAYGTLLFDKTATDGAVSGSLSIGSGTTVQLLRNAQIGNSSSVSISSSGTLDLNGKIEGFNGLSTGSGSTVSLGIGALTVGLSNGSSSLSGVISGTGGFTKSGSGTLFASGTNTYTGQTTVGAGTFQFASSGTIIPTTNDVVVNGGTLDLSLRTSTTFGSLSGSGGTIALGTGTLTVGDTKDTVFYGSFSQSGIGTGPTLVKAGSGILTLAGGSGTFPTSSPYLAVTVNAGTLRMSDTASETIHALTGSATFNIAGIVTVNTTAAGSQFDGSITGSGGLTKGGTGTNTFTLNGINTYTGATTISNGTLALGTSGHIYYSVVTVAADTTLDASGGNKIVGGLAGAGTVNVGSTTLTVGGPSALSSSGSGTFTGTFTGTGWSLVKNGTGTQTIGSGVTTLPTTLALTVNAGTLDFNNAS
ncbi:MAG: autotransporter-associated beta strand repeat-containing protein, partial [Chloroflexi bacterium]|nr:autotransporter-associated beta strand repeat-containing protein [Chloroflexota bacterium]